MTNRRPRKLFLGISLLIVAGIAVAACGDSESSSAPASSSGAASSSATASASAVAEPAVTQPASPTASASEPAVGDTNPPEVPAETTSPPSTEAEPAEATTTTTTSEPSEDEVSAASDGVVAVKSAPPASPEEQAAMDAWETVFDSAVDFAAKAPHLEGADGLEPSNTRYHDAAESVGGIGLEPTAAAIDGDAATITYNVLFGGTAAYSDLDGTVERIDGVWTVSRQDYCSFLGSARTPCDDE